MSVDQPSPLTLIASQFEIDGELLEAAPFGSGHINDTYLALYRGPAGPARFVHQRINPQVFRQPELVMENVQRVTQHTRAWVAQNGGDPQRQAMNLVPARDGRLFVRDEQGGVWRTYLYVEGSCTYDTPPNLNAVYQAAHAFGRFQHMLADLPGQRLHETIPNFHHTPQRLSAFLTAVEADRANRAATARAEIDFLLARQELASAVTDRLTSGELPERVTHNDTKINNVLFDAHNGQALCVIDLDTVMPGSALYDFGDMVRTGAARSAEDEPDASLAGLDLELFTQLARGYVRATRDLLTLAELETLALGARLIAYEQALRFLGDYLNDDIYYKIHRPLHNLQRARTQVRLLADMEAQREAMETIIQRCTTEDTPHD
jgi:Ser/Thr protein kinase RdoA (MazF antagonist)